MSGDRNKLQILGSMNQKVVLSQNGHIGYLTTDFSRTMGNQILLCIGHLFYLSCHGNQKKKWNHVVSCWCLEKKTVGKQWNPRNWLKLRLHLLSHSVTVWNINKNVHGTSKWQVCRWIFQLRTKQPGFPLFLDFPHKNQLHFQYQGYVSRTIKLTPLQLNYKMLWTSI